MSIKIDEDKITFKQDPGQGFFSCCTIQLYGIIHYYNEYHKTPRIVDTTKQYEWYKPIDKLDKNIKYIYFQEYQEMDIPYSKSIDVMKDIKLYIGSFIDIQYYDYRNINYDIINVFITKYFSPSKQIKNRMQTIIEKYNLDLSNICVLFYRGNDKEVEIKLPNYEEYLNYAKEIYEKEPNIQFLIQTDETEFIETMSKEFPYNHIILQDEIRHINKNNKTTVDKIYNYLNPIMSQNFLAITYIMSKCKYVLCNTGNCSLWIALFRGNCENFIQFGYKNQHP